MEWNSFYLVPILEEDRFLASGNGFVHRFDKIIADAERKSKCVDDTLMYNNSLEEHCWRMLDFL